MSLKQATSKFHLVQFSKCNSFFEELFDVEQTFLNTLKAKQGPVERISEVKEKKRLAFTFIFFI